MLNYLRLANETWTRGKWVFLQLAPGWIPSPTKRTPSSLFKFKPQVWFHYFNTHLIMWLRNTFQQRLKLRWLEVFLNHRRIMSKALICFNLALLDHVRHHLLTCFQKWLKKKKSLPCSFNRSYNFILIIFNRSRRVADRTSSHGFLFFGCKTERVPWLCYRCSVAAQKIADYSFGKHSGLWVYLFFGRGFDFIF